MRKVSKLNWNRLGFFVLGTFFGQMVFGTIAALFRRR